MAGAAWKPRHGSRSRAQRAPQPARRAGTVLGVMVGGSRFASAATGEVFFSFDLLDLDAREPAPRRISLEFLAHGFCPHPRRPHEAVLLEKRGPGGCVVDLVERVVLSRLAPLPGHAFYGHGAFTRGGDALLAVETELGTREGFISVRDGRSLAPLDRFPTFGARPHDCELIDDGKTLAVTNGGGELGDDERPGCVTFVDVASRKLLERFAVDDPRINAGHLAFAGKREFAVVSAPRDGLPEETTAGGVSLRVGTAPLTKLREPGELTARLVGETLSVCVDRARGRALATTPRAGLLTSWRLANATLERALELPNVRGVTATLDGRHYAVSYGPAASLALYDADTLEPVLGHVAGEQRFSGSHVYTWAYPS